MLHSILIFEKRAGYEQSLRAVDYDQAFDVFIEVISTLFDIYI
jgi:hypothetical protein